MFSEIYCHVFLCFFFFCLLKRTTPSLNRRFCASLNSEKEKAKEQACIRTLKNFLSRLPFKYSSKVSAQKTNSRWTTRATKVEGCKTTTYKRRNSRLFHKGFSMSIIRENVQVSYIKHCFHLVLFSAGFLTKNLLDRHTAYFLMHIWVKTIRSSKHEGFLCLLWCP